MNALIIILIILVVIAIFVMVMLIARRGKVAEPAQKDDIGLKLILEQINELNRTVDNKIGESARHMRESMQSQLS